jgi:hypothetical protein
MILLQEGGPGDDDDDEEEEEEDIPRTKGGAHGRQRADVASGGLAPSSPASTGPPMTPRDEPFAPSIQAVLAQHDAQMKAKVRVVRRAVEAGVVHT